MLIQLHRECMKREPKNHKQHIHMMKVLAYYNECTNPTLRELSDFSRPRYWDLDLDQYEPINYNKGEK